MEKYDVRTVPIFSAGSTWVVWQGSGPFILGRELCAPGPICLGMGVGACEVEPSLIEDYLLNYSSTASV